MVPSGAIAYKTLISVLSWWVYNNSFLWKIDNLLLLKKQEQLCKAL